MFSFASKKFTRIYVYSGWLYIEARNNWGGQLKGWFCAGIYLDGFWKRGPRFLWQSKPDRDLI